MNNQFSRSDEAELAVLGSILISKEARAKAHELLTRNDFFKKSNAILFEAIMNMFEKGEPIDAVTLTTHLSNNDLLERVGGPTVIASLLDLMPSVENYENYAQIVYEKSMRRKLAEAAVQIVSLTADNTLELNEIIAQANNFIGKVSLNKCEPNFIPFGQVLKEAHAQIMRLHNKEISTSGLPTGFKNLDIMTGGLQSSDLIILAGRPSMGKTALALNLIANISSRLLTSKTTAIFSIEMSNYQLGIRTLSATARLEVSQTRKGELDYEQERKLNQALDKLEKLPIVICDSCGISLADVCLKCKLLNEKQPLELIVIDYLQLMNCKYLQGRSRENEIATTTRGLKQLARELNIPILVLSQLSRKLEDRPNKRPMLSDLRESGAIEQDADVVMFIHRDDYYDPSNADLYGKAVLIIAKQRNGPTGEVALNFNRGETRFSDAQDYFGSGLNKNEPEY